MIFPLITAAILSTLHQMASIRAIPVKVLPMKVLAQHHKR